jgi:uncharacterized protein
MNSISLKISGAIPSNALPATARTLAVAALFGLSLERQTCDLFPPFTLDISGGQIILITGPSGSGKSTILRSIHNGLAQHSSLSIQRLEQIPLSTDRSIVDCFDLPLETTLACLSRAGLSEAHLLLRPPAELSEGQQFRYRLARFLAGDSQILLADEFCATLDRITAKVVASQLRKFLNAAPGKIVCLATTHEDLTGDLGPDLWLYKGLSAPVEIKCATSKPIPKKSV